MKSADDFIRLRKGQIVRVKGHSSWIGTIQDVYVQAKGARCVAIGDIKTTDGDIVQIAASIHVPASEVEVIR
jgi:hypothetical protein